MIVTTSLADRMACDLDSVRESGYEPVVGLGKVFHPHHASGHRDADDPNGAAREEDQDAAASWSAPFWHGEVARVGAHTARRCSAGAPAKPHASHGLAGSL